MISAWTLGALVPLIGSNIYALRKIHELRDALAMKATLLGEDTSPGRWAYIAPGGTMVMTLRNCPKRVRITSRYQTQVRVETE